MVEQSTPNSPDEDSIRLQFVVALDAWVSLEHAMAIFFYVFLKPVPYPRAASLFVAIGNFQAQREAIKALAADAITDEGLLSEVDRLLDRARGLATKRNRLIHGTWRHFADDRRTPKARQLIRMYIPSDLRNLVADNKTVYDNKGRYVFFTDDLVRCENEFRALKDDFDTLRRRIGAHLQISPEIEIPLSAIRELRVLTTPPSSHPPENHE